MKLDKAIEIMYNALTDYCENSVSSNKKERARIDVAFNTVLKAIMEHGSCSNCQ